MLLFQVFLMYTHKEIIHRRINASGYALARRFFQRKTCYTCDEAEPGRRDKEMIDSAR